jgi:nitrate reductase NapAB chaperone NapD
MAADTVGALTRVPGVINAVLIYHYGGDDLGEDGAEAQAVA